MSLTQGAIEDYRVTASKATAVVETTVGKVRGCDRNGICAFKGMPYGAPTAGANRFMAPSKPAAWTGVRTCLSFGHICPQAPFVPSGRVSNGDNDPFMDEVVSCSTERVSSRQMRAACG